MVSEVLKRKGERGPLEAPCENVVFPYSSALLQQHGRSAGVLIEVRRDIVCVAVHDDPTRGRGAVARDLLGVEGALL